MRRAWCIQCLSRRRAALAAGALLAGLMVVGAAYASTVWRVQPSPTGGANASDELSGVAATSATNAWAVGRSATLESSLIGQTLIEHWNGKTWKMVASPDPGGSSNDNVLSAVTATSSSNAWAVGGYSKGTVYQTLIERWNGNTWNVVVSPNAGSQPNNFLNGVVATSSSNAWAVGESSNAQPLVEHWDGATWQVVASPKPGGGGGVLNAVAATSPTNAWAVGESNRGLTLIEHWNGTRWKVVPSPHPDAEGFLYGVAATSFKNAWAVGYAERNGPRTRTLIEHWNGRRWKVVPSPNTVNGAANLAHTALWGVAATSSTNAWAVGTHPSRIHWSTTTLVEHWNGTAWKIVPSPNPGGSSRLNNLLGVAATSSTSGWAVGSYQNRLGTQPLVERGTR